MASVYKTLSSSSNVERAPTGEKKIKQRVLMLVREAHAEKNESMLTRYAEFERNHIPPSPFTAGSLFSHVSKPRIELTLFIFLRKPRPHSRKEAKLDTKTKLHQLNELAGRFTILFPVRFFNRS
jgi:ribosome biogenesis protein BRX1